jgi:hypothetical protein
MVKINPCMNKIILASALCFFACSAFAQEPKPASSAEELAKKLANPVASLISVPFQNNLDVGIGMYNGWRNTLNFQPVVPMTLTSKLNLISRVIVPIISQQSINAEGAMQSGIGDVVASGFISPKEAKNGLTWGAGPVLLLPFATNGMLGGKKWGIGPTALVLKQAHGWTYGALVNQIWSIAGSSDRSSISTMFVQPFLNYNWKSGAGAGANLEITQNWLASTTMVFLNPSISGVTKLGSQTVSLSMGPRIALSGTNRPDFGVRASVVLVFPK